MDLFLTGPHGAPLPPSDSREASGGRHVCSHSRPPGGAVDVFPNLRRAVRSRRRGSSGGGRDRGRGLCCCGSRRRNGLCRCWCRNGSCCPGESLIKEGRFQGSDDFQTKCVLFRGIEKSVAIQVQRFQTLFRMCGLEHSPSLPAIYFSPPRDVSLEPLWLVHPIWMSSKRLCSATTVRYAV